MNKLTLKGLKEMKPRTIFMSGLTEISNPWEYNQKVLVKWVATRGDIHDWAIYHSLDSNLVELDYPEHIMAPSQIIADYGAKLHDIKTIKKLVPCTKRALEMYRH